MPTEQDIRTALGNVRYPGFSRDIVSFGLVKGIQIEGANVTIEISVATRDPNIPRLVHEQAMDVLKKVPGVGEVKLNFDIKDPPGAGTTASDKLGKSSIPGVKKVIAVASGKGGVGKSTVASNLAVAMSQSGLRVGLCDCDLYGPSIAHMFGTDERPYQNDEQQIVPIEKYGLQLMSMGFLLEDASPVIVRGPIATRYTQQFLRQSAWNDLDVLVLDLPPGTGDIQLTIVQTVALDGVVIVTTPQEVALIDARKAVAMFQKVNVPILGIIENMSYFLCPSDGKVYHIFGKGGGEHEAKRLGVPLLGQIPIEMDVRESGDEGHPIALEDPTKSASSKVFREIAAQLK
ncbi:Mrp/NBP35 family ATP-binding protein [Prosthecobacter sp.]|uniref:Mrp/NBP35 family ATP-binding protein n=1 Tax=Prosthecobacter sp. TaxID=1965333 RepID=UPI002ABAB18F|nr:Mrp/NBP35 family ATP-binding protein [Prosthecobacter sp.]MDZ4404132.1 Mrp/NBP35 family ATP-binding protein [Prosthecobacter sp.]